MCAVTMVIRATSSTVTISSDLGSHYISYVVYTPTIGIVQINTKICFKSLLDSNIVCFKITISVYMFYLFFSYTFYLSTV